MHFCSSPKPLFGCPLIKYQRHCGLPNLGFGKHSDVNVSNAYVLEIYNRDFQLLSLVSRHDETDCCHIHIIEILLRTA